MIPPPGDISGVEKGTESPDQPANTVSQDESFQNTSQIAPVTTEPAVATTTSADAIAVASSISSQVTDLTTKIEQWKEDPDDLKDETSKEVQNTRDDIIAAIVVLGGLPTVPCVPLKKRVPINPASAIINTLACTASDLAAVSSAIVAGNVPPAVNSLKDVESKLEELNEDSNQDTKEEDQKSDNGTKEAATKQGEVTMRLSTDAIGTSKQPTYTDVTSTTVAPKNTDSYQPCALGTCGEGDSCPTEPNIDKFATQSPAPSACMTAADVPSGRPESALPSKREIAPRYDDDPDPEYLESLEPYWLDYGGLAVSGFFFTFPPSGIGAFGVKGLYGCTALVIVSSKGVYLAHIYEVPVFLDDHLDETDFDDWYKDTVESILDGKDGVESVRDLIGTKDEPGPLHSTWDPQVMIVTPWTTLHEREKLGIVSDYRYDSRVKILAHDIAESLSGSDGAGITYGYLRLSRQEAEREKGK